MESLPVKTMSDTTPAMRPLGSDQMFWWLINQNHPTHFAIVAEIHGPTTVECWRKALASLQRRHPNFAVNITQGKDSDLWFQHIEEAPIPLRVVESEDLRWEAELVSELVTPFDARKAPLVRAALIRQPHRAVLILAAHHAIADAKSIVFAIRDVLLALSGKALQPLPVTASLASLLPPNADRSEATAAAQDSASLSTTKPDVFRKLGDARPRVNRLTLMPASTEELRRRSRKEETTLHCALVTAAVAAARQTFSALAEAPINVISPSDMRKLLGAGEDVAPLAGGANMVMEPQHDVSFWETARRVRRGLVPPQTLEALSDGFAPLVRFLKTRPSVQDTVAFLAQQGGEKISVNNLGEVPFETRFGNLTLEAMWGPSILLGYEGERLVSAVTVNGSLNLLHTSYDPLPLLLETMERILITACQ
jgi:hypothetical protein